MQFPENIGAHGMLLIFRDYAYERAGSRRLLSNSTVSVSAINTVILPIPNNLADNSEIRLSRADMGLSGDLMAAQFNQLGKMQNQGIGTDIFAGIQKFVDDNSVISGKDVSNALFGVGGTDIAKDAMYLLRNTNVANVGRNSSVGLGNTPNPRTALTFEGSELKNHSFQWTLMPRNERESTALNTITNFLKRSQLPHYGGSAVDGLYLMYPKTVDIVLVGVEEAHFTRYKTGMIRSMTVNPTAQGGLPLLKGGRPAAVNIEMNIMEMDIHTAEDYEE
jgi:hypothetical protein